MTQLTQALWKDQSGQDLVEYVLLLVVIALGVYAALVALRGGLNTAFQSASSKLTTQTGG